MEQKKSEFYRQDALDWILNVLILALVGISLLNYGPDLFLAVMVMGVIFFGIVLGILSLIIGFILKKTMDLRSQLFLFRLILLVSAIIGYIQTKAQVDLQISIRDQSISQNGMSP